MQGREREVVSGDDISTHCVTAFSRPDLPIWGMPCAFLIVDDGAARIRRCDTTDFALGTPFVDRFAFVSVLFFC